MALRMPVKHRARVQESLRHSSVHGRIRPRAHRNLMRLRRGSLVCAKSRREQMQQQSPSTATRSSRPGCASPRSAIWPGAASRSCVRARAASWKARSGNRAGPTRRPARPRHGLEVAAWRCEPRGLIGERRPKKPKDGHGDGPRITPTPHPRTPAHGLPRLHKRVAQATTERAMD
jgi:hypothetical protein